MYMQADSIFWEHSFQVASFKRLVKLVQSNVWDKTSGAWVPMRSDNTKADALGPLGLERRCLWHTIFFAIILNHSASQPTRLSQLTSKWAQWYRRGASLHKDSSLSRGWSKTHPSSFRTSQPASQPANEPTSVVEDESTYHFDFQKYNRVGSRRAERYVWAESSPKE